PRAAASRCGWRVRLPDRCRRVARERRVGHPGRLKAARSRRPPAPMNIPRITVLISGRGSNLAALIDSERRGALAGHITTVISNRADAGGLAIAAANGIATCVVDH